MDKTAQNTVNELNRRIEVLQAKRDAVIKREKERKAKAQEKWETAFLKNFLKEFLKDIVFYFGEDYEETLLPETLAAELKKDLQSVAERILSEMNHTEDAQVEENEDPAEDQEIREGNHKNNAPERRPNP